MKGNMSITRTSKKEMWIYLEDEKSGTRFLEVQVTIENLMLALTGLSMIDCDFELLSSRVGKLRETKTLAVTLPEKFSTRKATEKQWKELLARYEVGGWTAYRGDIGNHHKWMDGTTNTYRVTFTRFVDAPPTA